MFIQVEGIDGAGKTTQCGLLQAMMAAQSIPTVVVKELDSTEFGKRVREMLLHRRLNAVRAEMFLFLAAKAQAFAEIILPHRAKGECVIADRGNGSFISYNAAVGLDQRMLMELLHFANHGVTPDLTILLDLPVKAAKKIIELRAEKSRFDLLDELQVERQRSQFLHLAKALPNWVVVDGTQEKGAIHRLIEQEVMGRR